MLSQVNWPATASAASGTLVMITAENAQQYNLSEDYVDYYAIADADDLLAFSALVNAGDGDINGVLISDIDMTGKTYVPIGYSRDITFGGYFEGNHYRISNIKFVGGTTDVYAGIFGKCVGATISNLGVVESSFMKDNPKTNSTDYYGGIAGLLEDSNVNNCYSEVNISCYSNAGGITGYAWRSEERRVGKEC